MNAEESDALRRRGDEHVTAIMQLFDEANTLCDDEGFDLFWEKLRPCQDQLVNEIDSKFTADQIANALSFNPSQGEHQ